MFRRIIALFIIFFLLTGGVIYFAIKPPVSVSAQYAVEIPENLSYEEAGRILKENGVISSVLCFKLICGFKNVRIQKGKYIFNNPVYPWYAVKVLSRGVPEPVEITVTIPEGKRLEEIAKILERSGVISSKKFLMFAANPDFVFQITGRNMKTLEGYLFPDTYKFKPDSQAEDIIRRLYHRLIEQLAGRVHPEFDTHQLLTLASIVEREAVLDEERPRIAGVFINRLKKNMMLEADPTVRFALNKWDTEPVLYADLEVNSPYNTYCNYGLPPGPISSVSRKSIDAVFESLKTDELFFVARGDGSHIFAKTYSEHLANVRSVRREVKRGQY